MSEHRIYLPGGEHAVLLIHGLTGSPFELKPLARKLHKAGFTVKAPCLAGHGKTIEDLKKTLWQDWYETVNETFEDLKRQYETVSVSGLCMGALLALCLASEHGSRVSSIAALSTTIFYDGWTMPWYRFLLPLAYYPPFRFFYSYREQEPYGIKNERLRKRVALALHENSIGYTAFPAQCMHELFKLIRETKRVLPGVAVPALIMHALQDDIASVKNAEYVERHIGSGKVRKVLVDNTYHMLTLDNERDFVADEAIRFFRESIQREPL